MVTIRRIAEATGSWMTLNAIYQQFGSSPDGAVERDMLAAEDRLTAACRALLAESTADGEGSDA